MSPPTGLNFLMEQPQVSVPPSLTLPEAAPCMMTWLGDRWVWDGKRSLLEWGCITGFDSSGQKGNRGSAERAGNCTYSFQSYPVQGKPELAKKQGWGALMVPRAQPKHVSCEGPSPTALRTAASRMDRGELRTTEVPPPTLLPPPVRLQAGEKPFQQESPSVQ